MPDIDGLTLVKTVPRERGDPRDPDDRPLDQGGAQGQGRGVRPRGQRLRRQAPRPPRAPRPDPLPLQGLHQPPPAQRGLPRPSRRARSCWPTTSPRRRSTSARSCPRSSRKGDDPDRLAVHPLGRRWAATRSATTGSTTTTSPSTCSTSAATASAPALLSVSALNALRSQSLPADRLPRARPGPRRPEPGVPDGPAERPLSSRSGTASTTSRPAGSTTPAAATRPPCS